MTRTTAYVFFWQSLQEVQIPLSQITGEGFKIPNRRAQALRDDLLARDIPVKVDKKSITVEAEIHIFLPHLSRQYPREPSLMRWEWWPPD